MLTPATHGSSASGKRKRGRGPCLTLQSTWWVRWQMTRGNSEVLLKPCSPSDGKFSAEAPQDFCGTPQAGYSSCFPAVTFCAAKIGTVRRACCTPLEASRRKKHRPSQPARRTSPVRASPACANSLQQAAARSACDRACCVCASRVRMARCTQSRWETPLCHWVTVE